MSSGIEFDEEKVYQPSKSQQGATKPDRGLMALVKGSGLATSDKAATIVLATIAVLCVLGSVVLVILAQPSNGGNHPQPLGAPHPQQK